MKKIQRGCPPYEGNEPYLYFCFAEKDRDAVFPLLEHLYLRGVRIWYNVEKTDNIRKLNRQLERMGDADVLFHRKETDDVFRVDCFHAVIPYTLFKTEVNVNILIRIICFRKLVS